MDEFAKPGTPGGRLMLDCSAWGRTKREKKQGKTCEEGDSGKLSAYYSCCTTLTVCHSTNCPQLLVFHLSVHFFRSDVMGRTEIFPTR